MFKIYCWIVVVGVFIVTNVSIAKPFIPSSDDEIIKTFSTPQEVKRINELRKVLLVDNENFDVLDEIVKLYLKLGRDKADPRYFGYAQALLEPHFSDDNRMSGKYHGINVPEKIIIHWADILQHRHEFNSALVVLDKLANQQSSNPQVYLMRANSYISQGNYQQALDNCKSLLVLASHLVSVSCVAQVKSLTGNLHKGFDLLQTTLDLNPLSETEERSWAISLLADMAMRNGQHQIAEDYFQQGLDLNDHDYYILANYADLLLKQQQYKQVISLLGAYTYVDSLLLRLAIASVKTDDALSEKYISQLESNMRLMVLRGEKTHLRSQARFYFDIQKDYVTAMRLAKQNWQTQKEPADAIVLINAAIEMRDMQQIEKIGQWVTANSLEDAGLNKILLKAKKL